MKRHGIDKTEISLQLLDFYVQFIIVSEVEMNKAIFVLLLISASFALRMAHEEDASTATQPAPVTTDTKDTPQTPEGAPEQPKLSPEAEAANLRFLAFIQRDNSLRRALTSGEELNTIQLRKLTGFMVNDPYFQQNMLDDITKQEDSKWIADLPKPAQIRFLKIITSINPDQIENPKVLKTVVNRLLRDKDIGPALKAKYGNEVDQEVFKKIAEGLKQAGPSHYLKRL